MQLNILKDARYFQIIFQATFLLYGILFLNWNASWWLYPTYFSVSLLVQFCCELGFNRIHLNRFSKAWFTQFSQSIPSALISSFGLSLLLKTNHLWVAALAASVSIVSKYLIRYNSKHIFNPSALGIVCAISFTGHAWLSPAQWGSNVVFLFSILSLGFIVTTKVQKLDVSMAFLLTFGLLIFVRQIIYLGWPIDFYIQSMSTGSLLLFTFFMITDPRTTPNQKAARISWAIMVACISFYLATFKFINGAPVWVLVLAQPIVPLLDRFSSAKPFKWSPEKTITKVESHVFKPSFNVN